MLISLNSSKAQYRTWTAAQTPLGGPITRTGTTPGSTEHITRWHPRRLLPLPSHQTSIRQSLAVAGRCQNSWLYLNRPVIRMPLPNGWPRWKVKVPWSHSKLVHIAEKWVLGGQVHFYIHKPYNLYLYTHPIDLSIHRFFTRKPESYSHAGGAAGPDPLPVIFCCPDLQHIALSSGRVHEATEEPGVIKC